MASRLKLHDELCKLLGSTYCYFQPPESIKLTYPCIVYSMSDIDKDNADDRLYRSMNKYEITVIDLNPDSIIPYMILSQFPMCSFDRSFTSDNLNHFTLTLYY